ncbi:ClpXP protease specificity-enhancing factor [Entomomonas asaccharolytica]|uniref:ClpXP protease specificity-enhancing factor n=1 Tax=Entomomonas asaccharolytica TaxID=2785331 RepID=A0A974NDI2_9GAMM|nr:ClpXP protease specificity-enhancing factor [Entomomonas asaccharolytica]QQP84569.1 ClpXP protease specificity-enhancing factor [Entomomonas asaccharolytica]
MNSNRPYLIRALYEWILDNNCTPYIVVDINLPSVNVPDGFAENGQIVLNLAPAAIKHLLMDNEAISFEGRFAGVVQRPYVPIAAVKAIYARENGYGMFFEDDPLLTEENNEPDDTPPSPDTPTPRKKPSLKIVK